MRTRRSCSSRNHHDGESNNEQQEDLTVVLDAKDGQDQWGPSEWRHGPVKLDQRVEVVLEETRYAHGDPQWHPKDDPKKQTHQHPENRIPHMARQHRDRRRIEIPLRDIEDRHLEVRLHRAVVLVLGVRARKHVRDEIGDQEIDNIGNRHPLRPD